MTDTKGVAFNAPPQHLIEDVRGSIERAVAQLSPGAKGAVVAVATEKGVNAAIVAKLEDGWTVQSWIGKAWGEPLSAGASVMRAW